MKTKIMIFSGVLLLLAGAACAGMALAANGFDFVAFHNDDVTYDTASFSASKKLTIHTHFSDYEIIKHDEDNIKVDYYEYPGYTFSATEQGDEIVMKHHYSIKDDWFRNPFRVRIGLKVKVYYPETLTELTVRGTSGGVSITEGDFEKLDASVNSGNISIKNTKMRSLVLHASSGNVNLVDIESDEALVTFDSGRVYGLRVTSRILSVLGSSGSIAFTDATITEKVTLTATSGYIKFQNNVHASTVLKVHSGAISVRLKGKEADYDITVVVNSGHCNAKTNKVQSPYTLDVTIRSGSGNISYIA